MIYVMIAHGFEEIEALTIVDVLRRAELEVQMVGVGGKTVTGAHGITVHCDIADKEVSPKNLEMIVLPGGMPGTLNLEKSAIVQTLVDHAVQNSLWVGAICAAPSILGHKSLLDGKKVTCYPTFESQLGAANYTAAAVERDGRLITGNGPAGALPFSLMLVECMSGAERASTLADSMLWGAASK